MPDTHSICECGAPATFLLQALDVNEKIVDRWATCDEHVARDARRLRTRTVTTLKSAAPRIQMRPE